MTPVHFTALSMVDTSYFVDAKHHCQHAGFKTNECTVEWVGSEKEMAGKCSEVKHEVRLTAAIPKLKITYMHHGRVEMYEYGTIKCREMTRTTGRLRRVNTTTNLGEISHPCCMKAPRENHRLLKIPKSFGGSGGL